MTKSKRYQLVKHLHASKKAEAKIQKVLQTFNLATVSQNEYVNKGEFQKLLGVDGEFTDKLFKISGEEKEGEMKINLRNFMATAIVVYSTGNWEEKTKLLFAIYDTSGDMCIQNSEMVEMFKTMLAENKLDLKDKVQDLVDIIFAQIDKDNDGSITYEEFYTFFKEIKENFQSRQSIDAQPPTMKVEEPNYAVRKSYEMQQIVVEAMGVPIQESDNGSNSTFTSRRPSMESRRPSVDHFAARSLTQPGKHSTKRKAKSYLKSLLLLDGLRYAYWSGFFILNILAFAYAFTITAIKTETIGITGWGLPFSRGFALTIKLNSILVLLAVCRRLITQLRASVFNEFFPLDNNIQFHKMVAYFIIVAGIGHTIAHYCNMYYISTADQERLREVFGNYFYKQRSEFWALLFASVPGITGHLMLIVLLIMLVFAAIKKIKQKSFEAFWYTHHLFILFYILLMIHGASHLISIDAWIYVIVPLFIYFFERTMRSYLSHKPVKVLMMKHHPAGTLQIEMERPVNFEYKAGQYIYVKCPLVARWQWHPFTLTSAPEEGKLSVHVRAVGNWTKALHKLFKEKPIEEIKLYIDGPYGAPSEHIFNFDYVIAIGAGIGVTPFISLLKHIRVQLFNDKGYRRLGLKKCYFHWICREQVSFEWFSDMLHQIEKEPDADKFININTYITSAKREGDDIMAMLLWLALELYHGSNKADVVTGLKSKTTFSRPNWDSIFSKMAEAHPGELIGVFFCGPKVLSTELKKLCKKHNSKSSANFMFFKENF